MDRRGHQMGGKANYIAVSGSTTMAGSASNGDIMYACYDAITKSWSYQGTSACLPAITISYPNTSPEFF